MTGEVLDQAVMTLDELLRSDEDTDREQLRRHQVTRALRRAEELFRTSTAPEDAALLEALRRAVPTVAHRVAYGTVRGAARRDRRRSSTTLPSLATLAQRLELVKGIVSELVPALPLQLYGRAAEALDHVAAALEQIRPSVDEPG